MLIVIFISLILPTDIRRVKRPGVGGSGPLPHTWRGVLILTDRLPAALFHLSLTLEEASPFFLPFRVKSPAGISFFFPPLHVSLKGWRPRCSEKKKVIKPNQRLETLESSPAKRYEEETRKCFYDYSYEKS